MTVSSDNASGNWIKRADAANILEISYASVRRLEGKELFPKRDDRGVWWFLESQVREVARRLKETSAKVHETCDGETAAKAFELLDAGKNPADLVTALRIHPGLARALHRDWADMRGGFVVMGEALAKLCALPVMTWSYPATNAEELLDVLESASFHECNVCEHRDARICTWCAIRDREGVVRYLKGQEAREAEFRARAAERKARKEAAAKAATNAARIARDDAPSPADQHTQRARSPSDDGPS